LFFFEDAKIRKFFYNPLKNNFLSERKRPAEQRAEGRERSPAAAGQRPSFRHPNGRAGDARHHTAPLQGGSPPCIEAPVKAASQVSIAY
jgi:hypothetical protein